MSEVSCKGRWSIQWAAGVKEVDKNVESFQPDDMVFAPEVAHSNDTLYVEKVVQELARLVGSAKLWEIGNGGKCEVRVWREEGWKVWKTKYSEGDWGR
jgi:hypothetical protein